MRVTTGRVVNGEPRAPTEESAGGKITPQLVQRGDRLIARPRDAEGERTQVDMAKLIEDERNGPEDLLESQAIRDYLDEKISLGKAAELLQLSRFELEDIFQRLGIPLRRGALSIEDAQAEIAVTRYDGRSRH